MAKSILITGTSTGIGLATVERFVGEGYQVAATVRKVADEKRLGKRFPAIDVLNVDLSDEKAIDKVIGGYLKSKGGVDIIVNNAGYACVGPVEELAMKQWRAQMETNVFAVINICRLSLPYMREKGFGRIIQISSGIGQSGLPIFAPYSASKHALEGFSASMRYEMSPFGIGVSIIGPGPVESSFDANREVTGEVAVDSPYHAIITQALERTRKAHENESSADDVVDKIFEAATAKRPKLRYEVGLLGYAATWSKYVPSRIIDIALRPASG